MAQENLKKNAEGYSDPTAYKAIKSMENENKADERFHRLLDTIFSICELSGFHIEDRMVIKDNKTGNIWR